MAAEAETVGVGTDCYPSIDTQTRDTLTAKHRGGASVESSSLGRGTGHVTQVTPLPGLAMMLSPEIKCFPWPQPCRRPREARCPLSRARWGPTAGTTPGRMPP